MPARFALTRKTDDDARPAIGGFRRQFFHGLQARFQKSRLQYQVFRRIAGYEQLGQKQEIGTLRRRIGPCFARPGEIARHVANSRIELPDGNSKMVLMSCLSLMAFQYRARARSATRQLHAAPP